MRKAAVRFAGLILFCILVSSGRYAYAADYNLNQSPLVYVFANQNYILKGEQSWVQKVPLLVNPTGQNGSLLIPLDAAAKVLNAQYSYVSKNQYQISKGSTRIIFTLDSFTAKVNGVNVSIQQPAKSISGIFNIPLKFTAETLGYRYTWYNDQKRAVIFIDQSSTVPGTAFRNLAPGSSGSDVVELQSRLAAKGFLNSSVSGSYDSATQTAVSKLQQAAGLNANGQVDPNTFASIDPNYQWLYNAVYTVKPGDTLWIISQKFGVTVDALMRANNLSGTMIYVGQKFSIPAVDVKSLATGSAPVYNWPSVTYIVQYGDTANSISKKFGVPAADIMKYNYMGPDEWFTAGDRIAISGYAPRIYTANPGTSSAPAPLGKLVDWVDEGQYLLKNGNVFTIMDSATGKQFQVKMLGGYNHADVETLTAADTQTMFGIFNNAWTWTPRPVVIFKDGMSIAGSLSGMPHDIDTISNNNMQGHCDLYLYHSSAHGASVSVNYELQHETAVLKAAGK